MRFGLCTARTASDCGWTGQTSPTLLAGSPHRVRHLGRPLRPCRRQARLLGAYTGEDVIAVDTTAAQVHADGIAVRRVVAPGAHPLPTGRHGGTSGLPHPFG